MKVLVLGATGLIGSAVVARMASDGVSVVATRRGGPVSTAPLVQWVQLDLRRASSPEVWAPLLKGVDAVVNCAGVLQDSLRDSTRSIHVEAPAALFNACEAAGVRRLVHVSAMGADRNASGTAFSSTKGETEAELMARDLDWVILRPSVVLGRGAYGGSALLRGLAALPVAIGLPEARPLQVIQLDDLVATIAQLLRPDAPAHIAFDMCGPDALNFETIVATYRRWLGWPPARLIRLPSWLLAVGFVAGDAAGLLGWRPPMRTTARRELLNGSVGDNAFWIGACGIEPRSLAAALTAEPASVQERWFARLYFLKPLVFVALTLFWLMTALITLGPGFAAAVHLLEAAGAGPISAPAAVSGALADLLIAGMIAFRPTARLGLWTALGVSLAYLVAGSALLPALWADPLGPFCKLLPILVLNLVALAILDDR